MLFLQSCQYHAIYNYNESSDGERTKSCYSYANRRNFVCRKKRQSRFIILKKRINNKSQCKQPQRRYHFLSCTPHRGYVQYSPASNLLLWRGNHSRRRLNHCNYVKGKESLKVFYICSRFSSKIVLSTVDNFQLLPT